MLCEKRRPYYNQPISAINCCNIGDRKVPPFPHRYDKSLVLLSWPTEWPESRGPSQRELLCSHAETHPQGPSSLPVVTRENINHFHIPYIHYLKDTHNYNTKATTKNNLVLPKCKRISGCRTFHTSATRLWNNVDVSIRDTTSHKQFAGKVRQKLLRQNATLEHFVISSTF